MKNEKIAIMQPYLFPYLGYFQLIDKVDKFIFYDDVNYIKKGWINRNNLLINGVPTLFTVPLIKASQNKLICETEVTKSDSWIKPFLKTIEFNYKKSPNYNARIELIKRIVYSEYTFISDLAIISITKIFEYLDLKVHFEKSSELYASSKGFEKEERLICIANTNNASHYINPIGGVNLYNKETFKKKNIELQFIKTEYFEYSQNAANFVSGLSIIDLLMNMSIEDIRTQIKQGELL